MTALIVSVPCPIRAGEVNVMGVLAATPHPGPPADLLELTAALRLAISERSPGVIDTSALRSRMSRPASAPDFESEIKVVREAYLKDDYERCVQTLRAVISSLEALPEDAQTYQRWVQAMSRLAAVELDFSHREAAREVALRLLNSNRTIRVDDSEYPPSFVQFMEKVRSESIPRSKLYVRATAGEVHVFVDGREVGLAPLELDLSRGSHRVSGRRGNARVPTIFIELGERDETLVLDFDIEYELQPGLDPGLIVPDDGSGRHLIAAGAFLRLDSILATKRVEEAGGSYLLGALYDVRRGTLIREGRIPLAAGALPSDGATSLAEYFVSGSLSPPVEAYPLRRSKTLGWTAFGGGVASVLLAGVSIWQDVSSNRSYANANRLEVNGAAPTGDDGVKWAAYRADGDAARRLAIGTGIGAAVMGATSIVLGYLSFRNTGEAGPFRF